MKLRKFAEGWSRSKKVVCWMVVYVGVSTVVNGTMIALKARLLAWWSMALLTYALFCGWQGQNASAT